MNRSYQISNKKKMVFISNNNTNSFDDVKKVVHKILDDSQYKSNYNFCIDLSGMSYTPIIGEMYEFIDYITGLKDNFKGTAAIITDNEIHHYLFKLSSILASGSGLNSRVFVERDYALKWLEEHMSLVQ